MVIVSVSFRNTWNIDFDQVSFDSIESADTSRQQKNIDIKVHQHSITRFAGSQTLGIKK